MVCSFVHQPETVIFAVDLDEEMTAEAVPGWSRFDAVTHAITTFVCAKKRLDTAHKFGLMTLLDSAVLLPDSISSSPDHLLGQLRSLVPSGRHRSFDISSMLHAVEEIRHEAQLRGSLLRVIMIYSRSNCVPVVPLPAQKGGDKRGLALDCVYIHDKPVAGLNRPQDVYSALEDAVDDLSAAAGHQAYVYETGGGNVKKLLTLMAMLIAHPLQRRPQGQLPPTLDLATAPIKVLPSEKEAATAALGPPPPAPSGGGMRYATAAATPASGRTSPEVIGGGSAAVAAAAPAAAVSAAAAVAAASGMAVGASTVVGEPLASTAADVGYKWGYPSDPSGTAALLPPQPPGAPPPPQQQQEQQHQHLLSGAGEPAGGRASRGASSGSGSHPIADLLHMSHEEDVEDEGYDDKYDHYDYENDKRSRRR